MDRLYAGFVRRGDLVFDIGAHVGDRVASFRRLGARIVAGLSDPANFAAEQKAGEEDRMAEPEDRTKHDRIQGFDDVVHDE